MGIGQPNMDFAWFGMEDFGQDAQAQQAIHMAFPFSTQRLTYNTPIKWRRLGKKRNYSG